MSFVFSSALALLGDRGAHPARDAARDPGGRGLALDQVFEGAQPESPLHELVPWKEPAIYWNELLAGKYEWSSIGKQLRERGLVRG